MNAGELETRIQQLLDGDLNPEQWPELRDLLRSSEEVRQIYVEHVRLQTELAQIRQEKISLIHPVLPVDRLLSQQRFRQLRIAGFAAAALIALVAVVMSLILVKNRNQPVTLTASHGSRFSIGAVEGGGAPTEALSENSTLRLEQGVVELQFGSGSRSVLRAPAEITIDSASQWHLNHGIAWFQISGEDAGFRVVTSQANVTDLGTEFGVMAQDDSAHAVHLFKGAIQVQSPIGFRDEASLRDTAARTVSPAGRLKTSPVNRDRFFTGLPSQLPWIGWDFDAPKPADWQVQGLVPEIAEIGGVAKPLENSITTTSGRFGKGLHISGDGGWWRTNWFGIAGDAPRTLAFWIRISDREDYIHPLVGWGLRSDGDDPTLGSFFSFVETVDGRNVVGASLGGYWIKGESPVADDRWHHVAISSTGRHSPDGAPDLRLYLDGQLEPVSVHTSPRLSYSSDEPLVLATNITHPKSQPLSAFSQLFDDGSGGHPFAGAIDELRIIEGVLSPEEIRELAESNLLPSSTDPDEVNQSK